MQMTVKVESLITEGTFTARSPTPSCRNNGFVTTAQSVRSASTFPPRIPAAGARGALPSSSMSGALEGRADEIAARGITVTWCTGCRWSALVMLELADRSEARIIGIDLSEHMLARGRRSVTAAGRDDRIALVLTVRMCCLGAVRRSPKQRPGVIPDLARPLATGHQRAVAYRAFARYATFPAGARGVRSDPPRPTMNYRSIQRVAGNEPPPAGTATPDTPSSLGSVAPGVIAGGDPAKPRGAWH